MQVGQHHVGGGAVGVLAVVMVGVRMVLTCLENHPLVGARRMGECHVSFPIAERERGRKLDALGEIRAAPLLPTSTVVLLLHSPQLRGSQFSPEQEEEEERRKVALV